MRGKFSPAFGAARAAAILGIALTCVTAVRADVVLDTFDGGGTFHPTFWTGAARAVHDSGGPGDSSLRLAVRFTVPAGPTAYTLDSITVPLSQSLIGVTQDLLRFRLTADSGTGLSPGATLETLSENRPLPNLTDPFTTTTTFTSTAHPTLTPGGIYWMVTELTAWPSAAGSSYSATYHWFQSSSGPTSFFIQDFAFGPMTLPSDPWVGTTDNQRQAYRINGTLVPEPASFGVFGLATVTLITRRRRR